VVTRIAESVRDRIYGVNTMAIAPRKRRTATNGRTAMPPSRLLVVRIELVRFELVFLLAEVIAVAGR
jgi:hypothetical protein